MNIGIRQSELITALKALSPLVERRSVTPVHACVMVHVSAGGVSIRAAGPNYNRIQAEYSLELGSHGSPFAKEESLLLPLHNLINAVTLCTKRGGKKNDDPVIYIENKGIDGIIYGTRGTGKGNGPSFTVTGMKPDLFTSWEIVTSPLAQTTRYSAETFNYAIGFVMPAVCKDETRFHLNGIFFDSDKVVSTDGHRLHIVKGLPKQTKSMIIPSAAINIAFNALGKTSADHVRFSYYEQQNGTKPQVEIITGPLTVVCRPIDATFPPYGQVVPRNHKRTVSVLHEDLSIACDAAAKIGSSTRRLVFEVDNNRLTATASHPDNGNVSLAMDARVSGNPIKIGVNSKYLQDILDQFDDLSIKFHACDEMDPFLFESGDRMAVLMPMKV